jgi:hypothetical protein
VAGNACEYDVICPLTVTAATIAAAALLVEAVVLLLLVLHNSD